MIRKFKNTKFSPIDRPMYYRSHDKTLKNFITLGKGTYVNGAVMNFNIQTTLNIPNILIGRFSSLSWNLLFTVGYNHRYKNVVSTFPFHQQKILNKFFSQIKDKENLSVPVACENTIAQNNNYQIIIGNDVWIGRGANIIGGVKIGSGAIIGTNAMVTKDIPPYAIAVGNPIKIIKYRFDENTIKKFMAIKWWNWDLKKILENIPLMNNPEEFLDKYYSPELEEFSPEKIPGGGDIQEYLAEGRQIYSFIADFHATQPLWRRVISGFCKSTSDNAVLIFYLGDANQGDIYNLKKFFVQNKMTDSKIIHCIPIIDNKIFSPYIIRNSTHFITNREMISLECMDYLWDTDVKIISALDENIFTGEPKVDWNIIK